jgi:hypothetical protein
MATSTYLKQVSGALTEARTVEVSAGSGDAGKIPNLNASGKLDATVVNATVTSAGAGDSGKVAALDGSGKLDPSTMPLGVGSEALAFTTTEAVSAGDLLNLWNSSGPKARRADASNGRQAHCYTLTGALSGASVTVYFVGFDTQVTSRTPGITQFLSATTAGACTETAPSTAGQIVQVVGFANSATSVSFEADSPITLA